MLTENFVAEKYCTRYLPYIGINKCTKSGETTEFLIVLVL